MDEALYDEFGNYIGPELSEEDEVTQAYALRHPFVLGCFTPESDGRACKETAITLGNPLGPFYGSVHMLLASGLLQFARTEHMNNS